MVVTAYRSGRRPEEALLRLLKHLYLRLAQLPAYGVVVSERLEQLRGRLLESLPRRRELSLVVRQLRRVAPRLLLQVSHLGRRSIRRVSRRVYGGGRSRLGQVLTISKVKQYWPQRSSRSSGEGFR